MATRWVALLRGINVGGHRVAMADLRAHFDALRFREVETFIASGNVIFSTRPSERAALERRIAMHLESRLGFAVPTFLRTPDELARAAGQRPFADIDMDHVSHTVHVGFLRDAPPPSLAKALQAHQTARDAFAVRDHEIFWLIRGRTMDSLVTWQKVEKLLNVDVTMRSLVSLKKLVHRVTPSTNAGS